jgi:CRISPR-associated protein Csx3
MLVKTIRVKGAFTNAFTQKMARFLQNRHLPLIVDVGGLPTSEQQAIFRHATHAVLLIGERADDADAYGLDLAKWEEIMSRQGVPIIAQIKSALGGENKLLSLEPIVSGVITDLERGQMAAGAGFDALVALLRDLFDFDAETLTNIHLAQAPVELTLDLPTLAVTLGSEDSYWQPDQLPALWDYLPVGKPLGVYGRSANWLYGSLAMVAYPAPVWLFDARLGWVQPPTLPVGESEASTAQTGWQVTVEAGESATVLHMTTTAQYIDIDEAEQLPLPDVPRDRGLVLSGKVPHWLVMAVVRQFAPLLPWTAVYQPPLGQAVVVYSQRPTVNVGTCLPISFAKA